MKMMIQPCSLKVTVAPNAFKLIGMLCIANCNHNGCSTACSLMTATVAGSYMVCRTPMTRVNDVRSRPESTCTVALPWELSF